MMQVPQQPWRLLIVDDSSEDRAAMRRYLEQDHITSYTFYEVGTGRQAMAAFQDRIFDCIILDYLLPDMTGGDFLERLRAMFPSLLPPIIILSGKGSEIVAVRLMKQGVQDYLIKDQLSSELLRVAIANAIEKVSMERYIEDQSQELARRQHAFQTLAENAPDMIERVDRQFRHSYVNPAIAEVTGLPMQAFIGKTGRELGMPDEMCLLWEKYLGEVFDTGDIRQFEFVYPGMEGEHIYQARLAPEFSVDGHQVTSVLGISRDVTELKHTEIALRNSEERLRIALCENGTWDWHISSDTITWSVGLETAMGLAPHSFKGTYNYFLSFVHPEDRAFVRETVRQAIEQKKPFSIEFRMVRADESIRWTATRGKVFYNDDGFPIRMLGIDMDITEQKQAQLQAMHQASELEAIFETIGDGLIILDRANVPTRINRAAQIMFDISDDHLHAPLAPPAITLLDEYGSPLPMEAWPQTRLMQGETLAGPIWLRYIWVDQMAGSWI
ncbi:PAS domain-containing response regulator [Dictyobacter kobayashii]|uniref:histidine kinase n=1 Tax=Dictyobacter kobayashii TaxID=2014872 RepID=A0A402ATR6_9CHLR|nr:response regulator [Dictyobacter kobayashii]GCE22510.1 hypothetical protein KDK_63100 [Dictyobacter kobayashii]